MASGQERILRRRIRSIDATKKITRAMELIAASRIVRAQARVRAARPYSDKITAIIANLAAAGAEANHPMLRPPATGPAAAEPGTTGSGAREATTGGSAAAAPKVAYVALAADRGLCGGYNNNVLRATERAIAADAAAGGDYELIASGRKALAYFGFRDYRIAAGFEGFSDQPGYADAQQIAAAATQLFNQGCTQVKLAYTQFHSVGNQQVAIVPFMPLEADHGSDQQATDHSGRNGAALQPGGGYEFEPEPAAILERLLPRYAEARLYSALLEASASEHAARQRAMKAATDNAEDLKVHLTRVMNRARQDAITTEIMEIVGGAEALAQTAGGVVDLLSDTIEARTADLFRARDK